MARKYHQLQAKFEKEPFFTRSQYYLLSLAWLRRWKVYVSYNEVTGASPPNKYFGCGKLPKANEDLLGESTTSNIKFGEEMHPYNLRLKIGLQEGKDFVYITKEMYYALESEDYDMVRVPRQVADTQEGKKVQLYYLQFNVILAFNSLCKDIEHDKVIKFYEANFQYSHHSKVREFAFSIRPALQKFILSKRMVSIESHIPFRFWLLPPDTLRTPLFNTFQSGCKANPTFQYKLHLDATLLDPESSLNEYDILSDSLIIAQIREEKANWLFHNKKHPLEGTCNYCRDQRMLIILCACKYAAYCSTGCKSRDKMNHKMRCPNDGESDQEEGELQLTAASQKGRTGLRNLGNTCFMNSGLQCISHIRQLTDYFLSNTYVKEINKNNKLGTGGELSTCYAKMVQHLWFGSESSYAPTSLKRAIAKYQPMFSGYNQHDAGELIGYLLDGLHEDLNRVQQKPYVETQQYDGRPDKILARQAWKGFLLRNQSIIVDLMYGQFKSVVDCPQCKFSSIQFDPFLLCSLPIINNSKKTLDVTFVYNHVQQTKISVSYDAQNKQKMSFALEEVRKRAGLAVDSRLFAYVATYSSCEILTPESLLDDVRHEHKYRSVYVRELIGNEDIENDIRVVLNNTICHSIYGNENYRKNIISGRLYLFSRNTTYKQVHFKLYSYYKKFYEVASYENEVVKAEEKDQPFRILTIPTSHYSPCEYCSKKGCEGCWLKYSDEKFMEGVKFDNRVEMEFYWRKNKEEIQNQMEKPQGSSSPDKSKVKAGTTIQECLELFNEPEILEMDNAWYCPKCKDHVLAKKQMQIYRAPKILLLGLKRFKRKEYFSEKYNIFVDYPLENFDLSKYVLDPDLPFSSDSQMTDSQPKVLYDLIGVSNHSGSTGGGHYTAYCKDLTTGEWYDFDDSHVSRVKNPQDVVSEAGYILFYRRQDA